MDGPSQIGEWRKISILGSGAFGVVSLWRHNTSDDYIAIKKCKFQTHTSLTQKQKERWNNEVEIMKKISHINIVQYKNIPPELNAGILKHNPTKLPLLPMEYCRKGNLRHILTKPKNICGLQEEDIRLILEDVCNGLQYLHNLKITHRDIKPDNIVLQHCENRKGSDTIFKIIDLGYAKDINDTVVSFVGTLHYLAPEIFETEQYNHSVDYWSMAIMTFEIICGVLPFLPHLPPFERFERIRKKAPSDICIYLSYSGNETYSSEIKKENYISSSFQQNIEKWLRHVLQYDASKRSENFPNNIKVFDYLKIILNKRIVTVFSVHKLEFYSYEINEGTLLSTLKDWISRDMNVSKNDLILIFHNNGMRHVDSTLVTDILKNDTIVYVFKKGVLVNNSVTYNFPKLLKELLRSAIKFDMKYIKQLYAQTIYYVTTEVNIIQTFKKSFDLFLSNLQQFLNDLKFITVDTSKNISKLLVKIECYNTMRKNDYREIDSLSNNQRYKDCLIHSRRLFDSLERTIKYFKEFQKKTGVITKRLQILIRFLPEIQELLKNCNVEHQYTEAVTLIERTSKNKGSNGKTFTSEIKDILSETIKIKDKLLCNKRFRSYLSAMGNVYHSIESLHCWITEFKKHISDLSMSFEQCEIAQRNMFLNAARDRKNAEQNIEATERLLSGELFKLPISYLIMDNHNLRQQLEIILSKSILAHKHYTESVNKYFVL